MLALQSPAVMISRAIFAALRSDLTCISSKGHKHRHLVQKLSLEIVTLAVQTPPVMISNAIFSRTKPIL